MTTSRAVLKFSPDGRWLAVSGFCNRVYIFQVVLGTRCSQGQQLLSNNYTKILNAHRDTINDLDWDSSSLYLLTAGEDAQVIL